MLGKISGKYVPEETYFCRAVCTDVYLMGSEAKPTGLKDGVANTVNRIVDANVIAVYFEGYLIFRNRSEQKSTFQLFINAAGSEVCNKGFRVSVSFNGRAIFPGVSKAPEPFLHKLI